MAVQPLYRGAKARTFTVQFRPQLALGATYGLSLSHSQSAASTEVGSIVVFLCGQRLSLELLLNP